MQLSVLSAIANMSENCMGNFSTSHRFLLKCLDFTSEILPSSDKCDPTLTENHVDASSNPAWSSTSRTGYVGAVTRIETPVRVAHSRLIWTGYKFINLTSCLVHIIILLGEMSITLFSFFISLFHIFPCRSFLKPQSHPSRRVTSAWTT